jgi:hypothetical protein
MRSSKFEIQEAAHSKRMETLKNAPDEEDDFCAVSILGVIFEVEHSIARLIYRQVSKKLVIGRAGVSFLLDDDLLQVVRNAIDDVTVFVANLEIVELGDTLRIDGKTSRSLKCNQSEKRCGNCCEEKKPNEHVCEYMLQTRHNREVGIGMHDQRCGTMRAAAAAGEES